MVEVVSPHLVEVVAVLELAALKLVLGQAAILLVLHLAEVVVECLELQLEQVAETSGQAVGTLVAQAMVSLLGILVAQALPVVVSLGATLGSSDIEHCAC